MTQEKAADSSLKGNFDPANAVVKAGTVQLNRVSRFLADLPDTATAELLVAPKDTARIIGRGLGTWNEDTASIRSIDVSHGIHVDGQALTGMQILDRPDAARDTTYEQAWANEVRAAWEQAKASGKAVTTGLAIGTKQIVDGCEIDRRDVTVAINLRSRANSINAVLEAQGGQKIVPTYGCDLANSVHTATEAFSHGMSVTRFANGENLIHSQGSVPAVSLPVALQIVPASPEPSS